MIKNDKKTKLEKKEWQKELESVYATAVFNKSNDLKDLYIKLEAVALKYINDRKMPEGTEFIIDVGTYPALKMKFFAPFSEIYEYDEKNDNWDKVLSKQNNAKFEYNNILDFYNDLLKRTGQFIGEKFPKDLYATINKSNPGDLLKFEHGNTYVCIQNDSKGLFLKKVKDKDDKLSLKAFNNSEVIEITTFENDLQKFYADNRTKSGEIKLYKLSYQNNDITSVQKVENEVSEQEFIDFYKEAYMHHQYELLKANKNYIDNRYKNMSHDIKRKIVKNLSEEEILESNDGEQKVTLTEHENVQIKYTDEDINNLLDSFDYNNSDFEDINDYDFDPADDD